MTMEHYVRDIEASEQDVVRVYLLGYQLREFVSRIFPRVGRKIALICAGSDESLPGDGFVAPEEVLRFLDDDRIVCGFFQNLDMVHDKAFALPIGLDFHSTYKNASYRHPILPRRQTPDEQERELLSLAARSKPFQERMGGIYSQFGRSYLRSDPRFLWQEQVSTLPFVRSLNGMLPRKRFWSDLTGYKFAISPPGNGRDCHRTWEILALGCVPIVQRFEAMSSVYERLPVWEVDHPSEITIGELVRQSERVKAGLRENRYDFERLKISWWRRHLDAQIAACK